jgi:hypothetical protein
LGVQLRVLLVLFCLGISAGAVACRQIVSLELVGPEELDGAVALIDGRPVGRFKRVGADEKTARELGRPVTGAVASIGVPQGTHELRIEKPGFRPIVRSLQYTNHGSEDYIAITQQELIKESI